MYKTQVPNNRIIGELFFFFHGFFFRVRKYTHIKKQNERKLIFAHRYLCIYMCKWCSNLNRGERKEYNSIIYLFDVVMLSIVAAQMENVFEYQ